jgi:hypothetical protein
MRVAEKLDWKGLKHFVWLPICYKRKRTAVNHLYLQFLGSGQGDLRMCVSRDQNSVGTTCEEVTDLEEVALKIPAPCATYSNRCPPIFLTVTVTRTLTQCSGKPYPTMGPS